MIIDYTAVDNKQRVRMWAVEQVLNKVENFRPNWETVLRDAKVLVGFVTEEK